MSWTSLNLNVNKIKNKILKPVKFHAYHGNKKVQQDNNVNNLECVWKLKNLI